MAQNIEYALAYLNEWHDEVISDPEKSMYVCKLALIELCGWLEFEIDNIVRRAGTICKVDQKWVEDQVIAKNYGFEYRKHILGMLSDIFGGHLIKILEARLEKQSTGDLAQLKSITGDLWQKRNKLAHTQLDFQQKVADAPTITRSNQKKLVKLLLAFEEELGRITSTLPSQ